MAERPQPTPALSACFADVLNVREHLRTLCGAQGRNRTTDTAIFNRMLYQLSYLGAGPARTGRTAKRGRYRGSTPHCPERLCPTAQGLRPIAARNRCFSATPSRNGSTRGGSSAAICTRANSVSSKIFQPARQDRASASSSLHIEAGAECRRRAPRR